MMKAFKKFLCGLFGSAKKWKEEEMEEERKRRKFKVLCKFFEGVYATNRKRGLAKEGGQDVSFTAMGVSRHRSEDNTALFRVSID